MTFTYEQILKIQQFISNLVPRDSFMGFDPNIRHRTVKVKLDDENIFYHGSGVRSLKMYHNTIGMWFHDNIHKSIYELKLRNGRIILLGNPEDVDCFKYAAQSKLLLMMGRTSDIFYERRPLIDWKGNAIDNIYVKNVSKSYQNEIHPKINKLIDENAHSFSGKSNILLYTPACGDGSELITFSNNIRAHVTNQLFVAASDNNIKNVFTARDQAKNQALKAEFSIRDIEEIDTALRQLQGKHRSATPLTTLVLFSGILSQEVLSGLQALRITQKTYNHADYIAIANFSKDQLNTRLLKKSGWRILSQSENTNHSNGLESHVKSAFFCRRQSQSERTDMLVRHAQKYAPKRAAIDLQMSPNVFDDLKLLIEYAHELIQACATLDLSWALLDMNMVDALYQIILDHFANLKNIILTNEAIHKATQSQFEMRGIHMRCDNEDAIGFDHVSPFSPNNLRRITGQSDGHVKLNEMDRHNSKTSHQRR